jgi:hypothetical protein
LAKDLVLGNLSRPVIEGQKKRSPRHARSLEAHHRVIDL